MTIQLVRFSSTTLQNLSRFFSPSEQARGSAATSPVDLNSIAQPETVHVFHEVLRAVSLANNDSNVTNEILKFVELLKADQVDVKTKKISSTLLSQEYYLANKEKPLIKILYSIDGNALNITKLEVQSGSEGEYIAAVNLKDVLLPDSEATKLINTTLSSNHKNFRYINEFSGSNKIQNSDGNLLSIATPRADGKFLLAHFDTSNSNLKLLEFGKANKAEGPFTEKIKLGALYQADLSNVVQGLKSKSIDQTESKSGTKNLIEFDRELQEKAAGFKAKANSKLKSSIVAAAAQSREQGAAQAAPAKSIRDFLQSTERSVVDKADEQLKDLNQYLEDLISQGGLQLKLKSESQAIKGLMGEDEEVIANNIIASIPTTKGSLDLHLDSSVNKDGIDLMGVLIPNLTYVDDGDKKHPFSINLCDSMSEDKVYQTILNLKTKVSNLLRSRDQQNVSEFLQILTSRAPSSQKIATVSTETNPNTGFGIIASNDKDSFVFEVDLKTKQLINIEKLIGSKPQFAAKTLSSYLRGATQYVYGKPGGGKDAYAAGGLPLLHIGPEDRTGINDLLKKLI